MGKQIGVGKLIYWKRGYAPKGKKTEWFRDTRLQRVIPWHKVDKLNSKGEDQWDAVSGIRTKEIKDNNGVTHQVVDHSTFYDRGAEPAAKNGWFTRNFGTARK